VRRPGLVHRDAQHALPPGRKRSIDFFSDYPGRGNLVLASLAGFPPAADGNPIHRIIGRLWAANLFSSPSPWTMLDVKWLLNFHHGNWFFST